MGAPRGPARAGAWLLLSALLGCASAPAPPPEASRSSVRDPDRAQAGARAQASAAEQSVRPGVNDRYYKPGAAERWTGVFEGESREVYRMREAIVERLGLRPGQVVADIGAGTGLYMALLAAGVGTEGRVHAVDIVPEFLERLRARAAAQGLSNVIVVEGQQRATGLAPASVDLAFLCNVYHHLEYPLTYMRSVHRSLRPDGLLVVIDFERIEGKTSPPMLKHVRAGKPVVLTEIEAAGFRLQTEHDLLKENYFLVFTKSPDDPEPSAQP